MPLLTVFFGFLLCGLSLFTLIVSQKFEIGTWLIPAGFGIALVVLGLVAMKGDHVRKHAMHFAALLGTLGGLLCLGRGIPQILKISQEQEVNMLAFGMVWTMAVICLTYVGICVQSFITARKNRLAASAQEPTQTDR